MLSLPEGAVWLTYPLGIDAVCAGVMPRGPDPGDRSCCALHLRDFWPKPKPFWGVCGNNFRALWLHTVGRSMTVPCFWVHGSAGG